MNQQQLEALLTQMGALGPNDFREETKTEDIPNPASTANGGLDPNAPLTIKGPVTYRTWVKPGTNQRLTVKVNPDGTYTQTFSGADPEIKPSQTQGAGVAAPTDQPYIGTRKPDGTIDWQKNPNYQAPDAQKGTTQIIKGGDGKSYAVPIDATGKPGKPIDLGLPADAKPGTIVTVDTPGGKQLVRVDANGTATVVFTAQQGEEIKLDKDGNWVAIRYGPGGTATVRQVPVQGQPTAQGPALPTLVLGQVQSGLRTYRDQLNQQVAAGTIAPAVADKRWKEATDIGSFAITEAQTFQRDEESRRNADVNLRTNAMSNATSGFNNALSFVQDLNGKLPEGSSAGAKAFEAILGMQEIHARRMGAYDNPFSGGAPRSAEGRAIDAATQAAVGQTTSTISNIVNAPAAPPAAPPLAQQNAGAGTGEPPSRDNLPAQPTAPTPAVAPSAPPAAAPASPVAASPGTAVYVANAGTPQQTTYTPDGKIWQVGASGTPLMIGTWDPAKGQPQGTAPSQNDSGTRAPVGAAPPSIPGALPGASPVPSDMPPMPPAGLTTDPADRVNYGESGDDFAALSFGPSPDRPPVYPALGRPDPGPGGDFTAMRAAQIEATPPWRLTPEDYEFAVQNGLMDKATRVPGRMVA